MEPAIGSELDGLPKYLCQAVWTPWYGGQGGEMRHMVCTPAANIFPTRLTMDFGIFQGSDDICTRIILEFDDGTQLLMNANRSHTFTKSFTFSGGFGVRFIPVLFPHPRRVHHYLDIEVHSPLQHVPQRGYRILGFQVRSGFIIDAVRFLMLPCPVAKLNRLHLYSQKFQAGVTTVYEVLGGVLPEEVIDHICRFLCEEDFD